MYTTVREEPEMICPNCDATGAFSTGNYHCDNCVAEEWAYRAREDAAEAAFLAELVARDDLTQAQLEAAEAAAEAEYDATVNR